MADTIFQTYQAIGNREDLLNFITNIDPTETPMFSGFARGKATATKHEWLTDTLAAAADNAMVEGADIDAPSLTACSRLFNYVQQLGKSFKVSDIQEAVTKAGRNSEYAYHAVKAMKELALDTEYAIVTGTRTLGDATTAAKLGGVINAITTNTKAGGSADITEDNYNSLLQTIHAAGGKPDITYGGGYHKRKISAWTSVVTRNVDASSKRLIASVDVYESDFSVQKIIPHRGMGVYSTTTLLVLEKGKWRLAILKPYKEEKLARTGSATKGQIIGSLTLEWLAENASGKHTSLKGA